jgi:hypothetical protein
MMTLFSLYPLRLCGSIISLFSLSLCGKKCIGIGILSSSTAQIAQRWQYGSFPPDLRQFSGISRASRQSKLSIQRLAPVNPPVISADVLHKLRNLRILCISSLFSGQYSHHQSKTD